MPRNKKARLIITVAAAVAVTGAAALFGFRAEQRPFYGELNGFVLDSASAHDIPLVNVTAYSERDATPPIDEPVFISMDEANLDNDHMGVLVDYAGEQRFYPYTILAWHEIVNDNFGSEPLAIIFRPHDEVSTVFSRQVGDERLRFGVSGLRLGTDTLFYDIETQSLWLGLTGAAVVGSYTGTQLEQIEAYVLDAGGVKERYPLAVVLSGDTGFERDYRSNPFREE